MNNPWIDWEDDVDRVKPLLARAKNGENLILSPLDDNPYFVDVEFKYYSSYKGWPSQGYKVRNAKGGKWAEFRFANDVELLNYLIQFEEKQC